MAAKPQLIQRYVTSGDRSLREWHLLLRRVTFGAALVLMAASIVSLHWACQLIGLAGAWEPVAWMVPLAMEFGMASVASAATTIRKQGGGYYYSLWVIFSFVMLLAQASNIGHAVVTVASNQDLPAVIPVQAVYVFACAFAALFPLGGTLFVHVSGFLRANGTGAHWIEGDTELVHEQVAPGAPQALRAPKAPTRAQPLPQPARAETIEPARPARTPTAQPATGEKAAARAVYERMMRANPIEKPDAARIREEAGITKHEATVRRWIAGWFDEDQAALGMTRPEPAQPEPSDTRATA